MIHHLVLLRIRPDVPAADVQRVFESIGGLRATIDGITGYAWGPYSSPEGLHRGYTHGFSMTFTSAAARDAYLPHPAHEAVKEQVLAILDGGVDGVLAFDFEA
ncbi:MAG: Dabb family protein [Planctomycetota bacterium]